MNKLLLTIMTMLLLVGCASTGGGAGGTLPDIAPYDEPAYVPLPAMVPAG